MCDEHGRLLKIYQKAVSLFSTTLDALEVSRATVSKPEYDRMRQYVEQTRLIAEDARMNLERHVAEHGCESLVAGASEP